MRRLIIVLPLLVVLLGIVVGFMPAKAHASAAVSGTSQVGYLLRSAAYRNGLPANLVEAIAWEESGWRQNVRSWAGAIGVMQLLPSTAWGLNRMMRTSYNPYTTFGNIALGTMYLRLLWRDFHGNLVDVISAYNEGEGGVRYWGIYNWRYVYQVLALMRRF